LDALGAALDENPSQIEIPHGPLALGLSARGGMRRIPIWDVRAAAAPFPLQPDDFSCRDALNFNRPATGIPNSGALFEISVNAQGENALYFRLLFAVAKMSNPPYCGEALRNEINLGNWTTSIGREISLTQPDSVHAMVSCCFF